MLGAVRDGRLTMEYLIERMSKNPQRIFGIPNPEETYVEVDEQAAWTVSGSKLQSRCGWTPFEGSQVHGRVRKVTLRGQIVYQDGRVLAKPGTGRNLMSGTI